jgi:hypothetical protein
MMDYIATYENVLPKQLCGEIIELFELHTEQHEQTLLDGHRSFTEINITKDVSVWTDVQEHLLNSAQQYLGDYMNKFQIDKKSWPESLGYEQFRMKRYMPNDKDEFAFHVDVGDYASARRFLVFFWYLNDVEEGGATAFRRNQQLPIEQKVQPKAGRLLIFPPLWTHPHIGMRPISGPKYIIGSYLHYV